MFAMVGEKGAPIVVPLICWNVRLVNSKKVLLMLMCRSRIMRLGSKGSKCRCLCFSS